MGQLRTWTEGRITRAGPGVVTLVVLVLSIVVAACGKGGGSGY